ncbi:MAG: hypothetical protein QGG20_07245 [Dehalococcoidia bacterium]|jgi:hypothetical protein|nr:hypothetical protein [Dehalococcoidia bacterium]|tara:strand:- start:75 stop:269 length:195 start_codon:yes stop_codon:yes gene_type:complete
MCRATAGPLLTILGVAGGAVGVGLALVRERFDRQADARAAKQAMEQQELTELKTESTDDADQSS